jgi:hypothetical protein
MQYPHRRNRDGSVDSICPICIATIARSHREADLKRAEIAHVCEPWRLAYFDAGASLITWCTRPVAHHRATPTLLN